MIELLLYTISLTVWVSCWDIIHVPLRIRGKIWRELCTCNVSEERRCKLEQNSQYERERERERVPSRASGQIRLHVVNYCTCRIYIDLHCRSILEMPISYVVFKNTESILSKLLTDSWDKKAVLIRINPM